MSQPNNSKANCQTLNPMTLPFHGSRLIEASAGTGKTYTISGLYLRLLLGIGQGEALDQAKPLTCEQILVVTFTNAATEELRDRIRKRIGLAHKCFLGLTVDDSFVMDLYCSVPEDERKQALRRLDLALKSLDEAAIFTIHGFCQRMLSDLAFESSLLFESEFTLDDSEFLHHAVRDFWREACYPLPSYLAQIIQNKFGSPDILAKQIRPLLGASQAQAIHTPTAFNNLSQQLAQSLSRLKMRWPRERNDTEALLHSLPLNGTRFGKKAEGFPKLAKMFDEIDHWATKSLRLPNEKTLDCLALSGLKLNKGGVIPTSQEAPLLAHIDDVLALISELTPSFLYSARQGISLRFDKQKQQRNLLTPDDLLKTLSHSLRQDESTQLASSIANRFPVALIDEFQDTDPLQFAIFSHIYQQSISQSHQLGLLMIGDPKQAIYAFRGADIYTYIDARQKTENRYNLDTNYRSSEQMVNAVNQVFSLQDDAFISESIPFEVVKPAPNADKKVFIDKLTTGKSDAQDCAALRIKLLSEDPDKGLNKATARNQLAFDAANEIAELLNQADQQQCLLNDVPLKAKDICVLVRDRNEAAYIQQALGQRNIGSVFLSRDSVFDTLEAKEMALLLRAMSMPRDERAIRSALATELLGYTAQEIHRFNLDETIRQSILEQFFDLHQTWLNRGIMPALLKLASDTQLINRLLINQQRSAATDSEQAASNTPLLLNQHVGSGERRLTDFRHLSELLQHKSTELDGINALVNWFEQALISPNSSEEQQLRLESEQNLVQIVTIHKSKGLEYPVCFLPFVSLARDNRRKPAPMLYHVDNENQGNRLVWDIHQTDEGWGKHKQEVLAEDLRLLYVALTRPVYRCYLYIANHCRVNKTGISSQLHETAIGYLLGVKDKACDFALIQAYSQRMVSDSINISQVDVQANEPTSFIKKTNSVGTQVLAPKSLKRIYSTPWRVGSYSGLVKNLGHHKVTPGADDEEFGILEQSDLTLPVANEDESVSLFDRFSFERGANAGSFMHLVLELIDFTQGENELDTFLPEAMQKFGIDEVWVPTLKSWYLDILATPLNKDLPSKGEQDTSQAAHDNGSDANPQALQDRLSLSALTASSKLVEMEFYLPVKKLDACKLNSILHQYGYSNDLTFDTLQGMLKGFIDLSFQYQGQYFIADYKSNHLGDSIAAYEHASMHSAIRSHRYDLQYILYTLAMHRFLQLRLANYDYDVHIGGCFYLFLRGMSPIAENTGVYFDKPCRTLIEALDALFSSTSTEEELEPNSRSADEQLEMTL